MDPGDPDKSLRLFLLHIGGHPNHECAELRPDRERQLNQWTGPGNGAGELQRKQRRDHCFYSYSGPRAGQLRHHRERRVPGYTETDMVEAVPEALQTIIKSKIPMRRFGNAEEIAKTVLFLVADGDFITGQQINVNGGAFM
jgi:hypothetical protein